MIENTFFQTTKNIEKAGAYYTDVEHCERLSNLFDFGTGDVCILEPSAGNGEAVKTITKNCINRKIFAVELSTEAYIGLKNDQDIFEAINCDFLQTKISHKSFSFCFANPPYIDDEGRMEIEFLKRIANYMSDGGILVYIVPYSIATNKSYLRTYLSKFEPIFEFRFDDAEYAKYRQIAFIGKRKTSSYDNDVLNEYLGRKKEDFPLIPKQWDKEKIIVGESKEENITFFTSLIFDEKLGYENLLKMKPQKNNLKNIAIEPFKDDEWLTFEKTINLIHEKIESVPFELKNYVGIDIDCSRGTRYWDFCGYSLLRYFSLPIAKEWDEYIKSNKVDSENELCKKATYIISLLDYKYGFYNRTICDPETGWSYEYEDFDIRTSIFFLEADLVFTKLNEVYKFSATKKGKIK